MTSTRVDRKHLLLGTVLTVLMGGVFVALGGRPLAVTFLPGLGVSWLLLFELHRRGTELPTATAFFPAYFATVAWQFLHFAEEYLTGFASRFPELYGRSPFSLDLFVTFNMVSYFVFVVAFLLAFTRGLRFLLVPVLFFLIYGAIGNALTHTWWVLWRGEYFPGFYTAQAYWVLGPWALSKLLGSRRQALLVTALFAALLLPLVTLFMVARG